MKDGGLGPGLGKNPGFSSKTQPSGFNWFKLGFNGGFYGLNWGKLRFPVFWKIKRYFCTKLKKMTKYNYHQIFPVLLL